MEVKSEPNPIKTDDSILHFKRKAVNVSMPNELQNKTKKGYSKEEQVLRPKESREAKQMKNERRRIQQKQEHNKKKQEQKAMIRKQIELLGQNKKTEMSPKEVLRLAARFEAARLRKNATSKLWRQKRKAKFTPEQKEAYRLKQIYHKQRSRERQRAKLAESTGEAYNTDRRLRQTNDEYRQKLNNAQTPEEKKAIRQEYQREYQKRKQEELVLIRRQAEELQSQELKKELSSEEKEVLRLAEIIEARRLRKNERAKKTKEERTPEEREAFRLRRSMTNRRWRQRRLNERQQTGHKASRNGCLGRENHATPDLSLVVDEIKTEREVFQETSINTFRTESVKKSFPKSNSYYKNKIDRRKRKLSEYFSCIKELINATAKPDALAVFGKHIAQMLRSSKMNTAEVDSAKLRIDGVLQNLIAGAYSSETQNYLCRVMSISKS